ncbi:ribosome recycling factor [Hypoxylon trugodes]|uniref:ribosome recycling factor n=1 Tax=Hypoxylon trugodes TaxID=326681 RepID=UPI0021925AF2|nr:ribosome recycling factor [Hypoxylon trugodes]KAI1392762.1 ribosome recycling factor [Hypoxylon trugodes]
MRNTTARVILRHALARPEPGRAYDVITRQASLASAKQAQCLPIRSFSLTASSQLTPYNNKQNQRSFHTTKNSPAKAKNSKPPKNQKNQKPEPAPTNRAENDNEDGEGSKHPRANPEEPLDFSDVHSRIKQHDERFRDTLKKMRTGGRFNPDLMGNLRVTPNRKEPDITYPLREVAQVIHRGGRTISILVNEEAYIKPIMSAVQGSEEFNQQPQRDPDNELELIIKIEPEKPDGLIRRIKAACLDWRDRVRSIRHKRDKQVTAWRKDGAIGPDMKRTVEKELEKIIKAKMTEIDEAEKQALKAVEVK